MNIFHVIVYITVNKVIILLELLFTKNDISFPEIRNPLKKFKA